MFDKKPGNQRNSIFVGMSFAGSFSFFAVSGSLEFLPEERAGRKKKSTNQVLIESRSSTFGPRNDERKRILLCSKFSSLVFLSIPPMGCLSLASFS
jgi:hypothetical protein